MAGFVIDCMGNPLFFLRYLNKLSCPVWSNKVFSNTNMDSKGLMDQSWTHVSVPQAVSCTIAYMMPTGVLESRDIKTRYNNMARLNPTLR